MNDEIPLEIESLDEDSENSENFNSEYDDY